MPKSADLQDPDFGATGQFEATGVYQLRPKADAQQARLATTVNMERIKRLVLVGGGHAHLQVLQTLARHRRPDVDVTLVTPLPSQTYSGMTPGYLAGHCTRAECQLDLRPLIAAAGVRWIAARCNGLDAQQATLTLDHAGGHGATATQAHSARPATLTYDLLSLDVGCAPEPGQLETTLPGASRFGVSARPIEPLLTRWDQALALAATTPGAPPLRVVVIGAGATAFELALAMRHRLGQAQPQGEVSLLVGRRQPLANYPGGVRRKALAQLQRAGIALVTTECTAVGANSVELADGRTLPCGLAVVAVGPKAPSWLQGSGLALDEQGHVLVNEMLQSNSHTQVFAAGDVSTRTNQPHPKNGVYAVRAGPTLALNLLASLSEQPLTAFAPPRHSLNLIGCGGTHAIASWGPFSAQGAWAWRWKDRIDREFVQRYRV